MHLLFSDFFGNQDYEKRAKGPRPLSTEPRPLSAGTGSSLREGHGYDDCPHLFKREKKTRKKNPHEKMSTALSPYRKCNPFFDTTRITETPEVTAEPPPRRNGKAESEGEGTAASGHSEDGSTHDVSRRNGSGGVH